MIGFFIIHFAITFNMAQNLLQRNALTWKDKGEDISNSELFVGVDILRWKDEGENKKQKLLERKARFNIELIEIFVSDVLLVKTIH